MRNHTLRTKVTELLEEVAEGAVVVAAGAEVASVVVEDIHDQAAIGRSAITQTTASIAKSITAPTTTGLQQLLSVVMATSWVTAIGITATMAIMAWHIAPTTPDITQKTPFPPQFARRTIMTALSISTPKTTNHISLKSPTRLHTESSTCPQLEKNNGIPIPPTAANNSARQPTGNAYLSTMS